MRGARIAEPGHRRPRWPIAGEDERQHAGKERGIGHEKNGRLHHS